MRWARGSLKEVPWRRPTPYYRRLPAGELEERLELVKQRTPSLDYNPEQEFFAEFLKQPPFKPESEEDPFATPKPASDAASIRGIRALSTRCSDNSTSSSSSRGKMLKHKRGRDCDDDKNEERSRSRPHPFFASLQDLQQAVYHEELVMDDNFGDLTFFTEAYNWPSDWSPTPIFNDPFTNIHSIPARAPVLPPRSCLRARSGTSTNSSTSSAPSRAQPGPITTSQSVLDPTIQSSLWDYQITYSRHNYLDDPPISPRGTVQPGSDWIRLPPPPSKKIRLGRHFKFELGFQRRPHHTTSRLRHGVHKTRVALKPQLYHASTLFRRLVGKVACKLPLSRSRHRNNKRKGRGGERPPRIAPLPTPFSPGTLGPVPDMRPANYSLPERAIVPEELPGYLEQSGTAMFHHNLLVKHIRWGARPENEEDWLEWCVYRDVLWEPAGSVPMGWAQYSEFWAWKEAQVEKEERKRKLERQREGEAERKMSVFSWVEGDDGDLVGLAF